MAKKHSSAGRYVVVWIVLIALTLTSFLFSLAHLGEADFVIALVIAVVKSTQLPANRLARESQIARTINGKNISRSRTAPMVDVS